MEEREDQWKKIDKERLKQAEQDRQRLEEKHQHEMAKQKDELNTQRLRAEQHQLQHGAELDEQQRVFASQSRTIAEQHQRMEELGMQRMLMGMAWAASVILVGWRARHL